MANGGIIGPTHNSKRLKLGKNTVTTVKTSSNQGPLTTQPGTRIVQAL